MKKTLTFVYCDRREKVEIDLDESLTKVFDKIQPIFGLKLNSKHYCFLTPSPCIFNDIKASKIFKDIEENAEIHITTFNDLQIMENFREKIFPYLRIASTLIPQTSVNTIQRVTAIHRQILTVYNTKTDFKKLIPSKIVENLKEIPLLEAINKWFSSFMTLKTHITCPNCKIEMKFTEKRHPTKTEKSKGIFEVQRYYCSKCGAALRVPSFEDPNIIVEKKTGFCSEICIIFGAILRSFGFDIRFVINPFYDHMWLEAFVPSVEGYVHIDPIFHTTNSPLKLEEEGNTIIRYVFAVGPYECVNVTRRYTIRYRKLFQKKWDNDNNDFLKLTNLRNDMWADGVEMGTLIHFREMTDADDQYVHINELDMNQEEPIGIF